MSDPTGTPGLHDEAIRKTKTEPTRREPFVVHWLFWGRDGLRSFWGILLFYLLRELITAAVNPALTRIFHPTAHDAGVFVPRSLFTFEGSALVAVAAATWLMAWIERRRVAVYGFNRVCSMVRFFAGALWGVVTLSLLVFVLRVSGLLVFDARLLHGSEILRYGSIWLAGFLLVGLVEEASFRGYLQFTLTRGLRGALQLLNIEALSAGKLDAIAFWTSAFVLSFGFGLVHTTNSGESPLGLVVAGLIGLVFCLSLWKTGSLWWAIGFHATWDWAESFLYGVADSGTMVRGHLFATHPVGSPILSGGLTGPEGSAAALFIVLLIAGIIWMTLPRRGKGPAGLSVD